MVSEDLNHSFQKRGHKKTLMLVVMSGFIIHLRYPKLTGSVNTIKEWQRPDSYRDRFLEQIFRHFRESPRANIKSPANNSKRYISLLFIFDEE